MPLSPHYKFYIATFGCKVNQYESQKLREAWSLNGGVETTAPEDADYILINSCAITGKAEHNTRNAVYKLRQLAPQAKIILSGCAAQFYADFRPRKNAHWALPDYCVIQQDKTSLLQGPIQTEKPNLNLLPSGISAYNRSRPIVKIQDGCSQNCAYCIVPQTRGKPVSRAPAEILAECRRLAAQGYGELVLSGVNLRQYGGNGDFWDLLNYLDQNLAPEFNDSLRLRISSIDPAMLTARSCDILLNAKLICPHLHLSLQHASPPILTAMRRLKYDPENLLSLIANLNREWQNLGLGADLIVGFPGETEADLSCLLSYIDELPLTYGHVFPYSKRQGTVAAKLPSQIAKSEKERRAQAIRKKITTKQQDFWLRQLNLAKMEIVLDAFDKSDAIRRGVNEYYAPCIIADPGSLKSEARLIQVAPHGLSPKGIKVKIL